MKIKYIEHADGRIQKAHNHSLPEPAGTKLSKSLNRSGYGLARYVTSRKRKNRASAHSGVSHE